MLFVKVEVWAARRRWGGVRGEKVLQLNYIVCGEETWGQTGRWQLTNVVGELKRGGAGCRGSAV